MKSWYSRALYRLPPSRGEEEGRTYGWIKSKFIAGYILGGKGRKERCARGMMKETVARKEVTALHDAVWMIEQGNGQGGRGGRGGGVYTTLNINYSTYSCLIIIGRRRSGWLPLLHASERVDLFAQLPAVRLNIGHFPFERFVFGSQRETGQSVKHQFVLEQHGSRHLLLTNEPNK